MSLLNLIPFEVLEVFMVCFLRHSSLLLDLQVGVTEPVFQAESCRKVQVVSDDDEDGLLASV
jgi:hypothetical protein